MSSLHIRVSPCSSITMNLEKCFVIGISGATCSGKSSLAAEIHKNVKNSIVVHQDDYFLPPDDPRHVKIPELNHCNWELLTSIDMERLYQEVIKLMEYSPSDDTDREVKRRVIILDGFLLYEFKKIADLCDLKFYLTLTKEQCWERRKTRSYDPPDVPGYFEKIVWPEYLKQERNVRKDRSICETIMFIDGSKRKEEIFQIAYTEIEKMLC